MSNIMTCKRKRLTMIISLAGLMLIMTTILVGCERTTETQQITQPPHLYMNANNGGLLSCDENQIVYLGGYGPYHNAIVSSSFDMKEMRLVFPDGDDDIYTLFLDDGVVYYTRLLDDLSEAIYCVNIDGSNEREILRTEDMVRLLTVYDHTPYYLRDGNICRFSNGAEEVLTSGIWCRSYCKQGDVLYYAADRVIGKLILSTGLQEEIAEVPAAGSLIVYNDYLYFNKHTDEALYRINLNSGRMDMLAGESVAQYIINADKIYFIDRLNPLYMRSVYNTHKDEYNDRAIDDPFSYFTDEDYYLEGLVFQMDLDGSNLKLMETDSLFSCLLFAASDHMYATKNYMDVIEPLRMKQ